MKITYGSERLTPEEYIDFLKRTDLGSQYPKEGFCRRIEKLLRNVSISLVARNEAEEIIGIAFGITDFAYWLFITDLGVDRRYTGKGIGSMLVRMLHERAGGEDQIIMYTCFNEKAQGFYEKLGMKKPDDVLMLNRIRWTDFTVDEDFEYQPPLPDLDWM